MAAKKKTALLINEGLSDNFGDQAIRESLEFILTKNNYDVIFEDLTRNEKEYSYKYNSSSKKRTTKTFLNPIKSVIGKLLWVVRNFKRILKATNNKYDIVVIGGGQLLISNGTFPSALFIWQIFLRYRNKGKVILFGVGLQGEYRGVSKLMFSYVLQNVKSVHVRDSLSMDILSKVFKKDSSITYDVAFIYDKIYKSEMELDEIEYKYALGVVDFKVFLLYNQKEMNTTQITREEYFMSWVNKLDDVNDLNKTALFYSTNEDRNESLKFKEFIKNRFDIEIILLENHKKSDFLVNMENSEIILSGRMHSLILALVLKKEIMPYIISGKIEGFNKIYRNDFNLKNAQKDILSKFKKAIA